MYDPIGIDEAARLLGCSPNTLRRHETKDGKFCEVYGHRIRVYRTSLSRHGQRRYDRNEIERLMYRLAKRAQ